MVALAMRALRLYGFTVLRLFGEAIQLGVGVVSILCRLAE
jgi:hypothetical protein